MRLEDFEQPFSKIAPYYDTLMSFVNYRSWVDYIARIIVMHHIQEKVILDIACGTGVCLDLWLKRGYRVIGLDGSDAMLEICKNRFSQNLIENGKVYLMKGDIRNFSLKERVPVITCLYDSLNYILNSDELLACFKSTYAALTHNGIFVFDMNTIHALRDEWGNQVFKRKDGSLYSIWDNSFNTTTNISTLKLTLNVYENDQCLIIRELHQERAYPLDEIKSLVTAAGFKLYLYRHLTFNPASEFDTRVLGVAKKL